MASSRPFEGPEKQVGPAAPTPQPPPPVAGLSSQAVSPIPAPQQSPQNGSATPTGRQEDQAEQEMEPAGDVAGWLIDHTPAWLVSMVFHLVMLIVMATMVYVNMPERPIELNAETIWAEKKGDQLLLDAPGLPDIKTTAKELTITPADLPPVDDPLAAPGKLTDIRPNATVAISDIQAPEIGMALSGRREGSARRQGLLGRYGGTEATETAVRKGLAWLARNQRHNGSWSLAGPYTSGVLANMDDEVSATAMALLAFQGDGNTPEDGKYKLNVAKGWNWLLKQQDADGCFFHNGGLNHRFYTHGQCGIAICELYGMTKDSKYREPAQRAIDYCVRTQSPLGGWRYEPNSETSDVSVTGWVVMALQSAKMAGLKVPYETLHHVERYLNSVAQYDGSRYPYQLGGPVLASMTAEALLMREYLGWKRDDPRLVSGMEWLTSRENLVDYNNNRNVYYWYYATQAAHHIEGDYWKRWNGVMRQEVPAHQVPRGKEGGSWDPNRPTEDQWGNHGGRLYVTCLSIYMLEVYYRHLPLYSSVYTYDASPPKAEKPKEPATAPEAPAEKPKIEGVE